MPKQEPIENPNSKAASATISDLGISQPHASGPENPLDQDHYILLLIIHIYLYV